MTTLFQIALSNAVGATVLALVAASAALILRRPPLTRALWVLVLLKLVTPPVWHVNLSRPAAPVEIPARPVVARQQFTTDEIPLSGDEASGIVDLEQLPVQTAPAVAVTPAQSPRPSYWHNAAQYWVAAVVGLWALGIAVQLSLLSVSIARLRRLARCANPADADTVARARELARRLGLRRCPRVLFVEGPMSPMLCAIGVSPRLLLPAELWHRLDASQRDTVLTHELAHLKRGDHWARALEVLVAAIYWWHPVVWWARRALREATEQCCDAWVLWALPRSAASYATALIEAIDFISTAQPAVPALASGMGQFTDLKRRLVMIKRGTAGKALSWPMFGAVCTIGGLLLPLAPSFGQVAPTAETVSNRTAAESAPAAESVSVATSSAAETTAPRTATVVAATPESTSELSVTSVESVPVAPTPAGGTVAPATADEPRDVSAARREVERLRAQLARAQDRLARLEGRAANQAPMGIGSGSPDGTSAAGRYGRGRGAQEQAALGRLSQAAGENQQQRLDALEGQVREILNELRQMKRAQRNSNRDNGSSEAK